MNPAVKEILANIETWCYILGGAFLLMVGLVALLMRGVSVCVKELAKLQIELSAARLAHQKTAEETSKATGELIGVNEALANINHGIAALVLQSHAQALATMPKDNK